MGGVESVSSKVELKEKTERNKLSFPRDDMATGPLELKKDGKEGLVKLEENLLVSCQKKSYELYSDNCSHVA